MTDPKLFDPAARGRMVRTFARGLGQPAAYVLPLRRVGETLGQRSVGDRGASSFICCPAICRQALASRSRALPHVEASQYPYVELCPTRWMRKARCRTTRWPRPPRMP